MNDLAQFQPAFNGVNTLLAVSTNIETEQITNGNLKLKGKSSFNRLTRITARLTGKVDINARNAMGVVVNLYSAILKPDGATQQLS
jgi:hypothetical protein